MSKTYTNSEVAALIDAMTAAPESAFWAEIGWSEQAEVRAAGGRIASVGDSTVLCCSMDRDVAEATMRAEWSQGAGVPADEIEVNVG